MRDGDMRRARPSSSGGAAAIGRARMSGRVRVGEGVCAGVVMNADPGVEVGAGAPRVEADAALQFLAGGGELGARMRAHDWAATSLGPPAGWPRSLKTAVRIMLTSRQPIWIGWGHDLIYLYNDPYK